MELFCTPYGHIKIGDIYNGIDWNLVNSYKPERCKNANYGSMQKSMHC